MNNLHTRFDEVLKILGIRPIDLSRQLGTEPNKLYNIINGRTRPSVQTLEAMGRLYPQINFNYLINGTGPVLLNGKTAEALEQPFPVMGIPRLAAAAYQAYSTHYRAGHLPDLPASSDQTLLTWPVSPGSMLVEVADDSMAPQLQSGAWVVAQPLAAADWPYQVGGVYLVLFAAYLQIRRIVDNALVNRQELTLAADVPMGGQVVINGRDLRAIWKVVRILDSVVR